ncbi:aspartyl/glutamyl-tRNA(Asn/Gln) amidotransferase, A subunit [Ehrlichia chaffeensis str. Heartland]|uniref:Glutamyl-tRNA(Gln) amidotransferase subunit A n=1 Tax=Ehrlichia chaffeensis (strain ATCC CRL-10679 / Arkansas) TaxID=205920 RepID=GATA_EHRCR|nr:Asp-tRNA(Asn)/Glu-tRNA(Gln) amidotransferase subunit GatA [Ehrlichia chaffeensis]Q2GGC5.1 RecName: Full=Glutamyl-tRNA(Gln) amidotransferase subunit A; Short=Glu-ADT subunit A [Ehrlichia chaffeensis str. Arkansas]ABD44527.1 glutamyl-tRNA(Gln) amidotransferase, A subunit [Ehrlichia chaffeensis str. Arkansas]AHX03772.1 aspartyl/glutamyl-tRNA(Asn/Gln) amidotransferase, A subunit [Ehrlichia chaffeensis str. Heartland]AHX05502.1 aspartyl/glutamyl-tRNA(Asn/Gln) amidotransferase, A subunit [Ehrlichi
MKNILKLSIAEMHDNLKKREFSAVELTKLHIEAVNNEKLNAFITKTPEIALSAAEKADYIFTHQKENLTPLTGIPVGIKDLFCTKHVRTTACSNILKNFTPQYDSTVTKRLLDNGAVMLGKLNMDEFAMGSSNSNSCFGHVKNPWVRADGVEVVPGGSSGGSSAAVAGFLCAGALGSDTGGSVRQPAALCGIVGLKPTYGRCSRFGMIAFASSLDQAGVLTRTVEDASLMLQSICGYDIQDSTSANIAVPKFSESITHTIKGKRIGIPKEYELSGKYQEYTEVSEMWAKGIQYLKDEGAEIIEISLPHTSYALPVYYIICSAEASSNLARYDGIRYGARISSDDINEMYELTRGHNFGTEVKRRILIGAYVLSSGYYDAYYNKAQRIRHLVINDFVESFKKIDYILTPTTPKEAFAINEQLDTLTMYLNDVFTVPASLAGLPAISVPIGLSKSNLPLSLQVIGNYYDEGGILNVASIIEKHTGKILK